MAVNCTIEPTAKLVGDDGATAMETNFGAGVVDKQAVSPNAKTATKPVIIHLLKNLNCPESLISTCYKSVSFLFEY
jgi:hypothetical protein